MKRSVPVMLARRILEGVRSRCLVATAITTKAFNRIVGRTRIEVILVRATRFLRVPAVK